ncbi:unnamed protein product [Adineta steineri]|uniref:LamG-like jellyroll fold domain-containing protein n=1 Tax=Adineta steineri TaxID=433720 RepID=A0A813VKW0_9BILA|nr:unnamed protein product [Adineta steineri]CAF3754973.1 unnamed protein product [Adineta steineri]
MLFQLILILFQIHISISTISLINYDNTQFIPSQNSYLLNNFQVQSQNECICLCYTNQSCITLTYFGINQTCLLYSSQLQIENLQLTTYTINSAVISFPNRISTTTQTTSTSSTSTSTTTTNAYCGYSCINTTVSRLSSIAFYSFDNNTFDSIGNYSMNATFSPSYVPGWIGSAINFTYNNSQFLSSRTHIPLDSRSFTIDVWFYVTDLTSFKDLGFGGECQLSTNDQCLFLNIRTKLLRIVFFADDTIGTTSLVINQWYHATFVYDSTIKQQLIYLNGLLDKSATVTHDFLGTTGLFTIGGGYIGGDSAPLVYYSGYIDQFGISYRVKTPCEIYLNAILFCYFRFDSILSLIDSGPNLITATNYNGIQTTGRVNQGIQFSSSLSYVAINGINILNSLNNPFTISMWINPLNTTSGGTLIHTSTLSNGLGTTCFALWGFSSNGSFIANFIDSSNNITPIIISTPFPLNQWIHIAQIFNSTSGTSSLYINGNLVSNILVSTRQAIGSYVFLGSSPLYTSSCKSGIISKGQFFGIIDEFYVFSQALTSTDICRLANS